MLAVKALSQRYEIVKSAPLTPLHSNSYETFNQLNASLIMPDTLSVMSDLTDLTSNNPSSSKNNSDNTSSGPPCQIYHSVNDILLSENDAPNQSNHAIFDWKSSTSQTVESVVPAEATLYHPNASIRSFLSETSLFSSHKMWSQDEKTAMMEIVEDQICALEVKRAEIETIIQHKKVMVVARLESASEMGVYIVSIALL